MSCLLLLSIVEQLEEDIMWHIPNEVMIGFTFLTELWKV